MHRQPIASAPRDGRNIIVFFGQDGVSQAKYIAGLPYPWQFIDADNNGVSWLINHAVDGPGGPSHWMPMPDFADTAPPAAVPALANPWHNAVLAECMRIEAAYDSADPVKTVAALIDWHVKQAQEVGETIKAQADNYVKMTCGPAAVPVSGKLEAFEKWARSHGGLSLESRSSMECENGWFPATYWSAMTEIAWRAFANAPASHQAAAPAQAVDALAEFAPYLKDGETPLERLNREIADSNALTSLLANERRRLEFLHSVNKDAEGYEYGIAKVKFSESGQIESFLWALSDGSDIDAALAAQPAAPELQSCGCQPGERCIPGCDEAPAGEPVAWLESEESARRTPIKEVMRGMFHTAVWHFSARPQTSNPVWTLHAPVANAGQAHDEDAAIRLRAVCKLVGIADHVPQDNETLWGAAFAVLGQIRRALEKDVQAQAVAVPDGWRLVIPGRRHTDSFESARIGDYNSGWNDCQKATIAALENLASPLPQQVAQKDGDPK